MSASLLQSLMFQQPATDIHPTSYCTRLCLFWMKNRERSSSGVNCATTQDSKRCGSNITHTNFYVCAKSTTNVKRPQETTCCRLRHLLCHQTQEHPSRTEKINLLQQGCLWSPPPKIGPQLYMDYNRCQQYCVPWRRRNPYGITLSCQSYH